MPVKIAICVGAAVLTIAIVTVSAIFFGTARFLYRLGQLEKKLIELNLQVTGHLMVIDALQNDLLSNQSSTQCKKCNCKL